MSSAITRQETTQECLKAIENTQLKHLLRGYVLEIADYFRISNNDAMALMIANLPGAFPDMELPTLPEDLQAIEEHANLTYLINSVRLHIRGHEQPKRDHLADELSHAYARIAGYWYKAGVQSTKK